MRARWLADIGKDVRFALRLFRRAPLGTAAAIVTIALAIGANTAIFSAVNAVSLRPLPFPHPERLYLLAEENPEHGWHREMVSTANADVSPEVPTQTNPRLLITSYTPYGTARPRASCG